MAKWSKCLFNYQKHLLLMLLLAVAGNLSAQTANKAAKKGDRHFTRGEYDFSLKMYQSALGLAEKAEQRKELHFKIAESYRLSNRTHLALEHYLFVKDTLWLAEYENAAFYLGHAYKLNGQYDEATAQFAEYLDLPFEMPRYTQQAREEIRNLKKLAEAELAENEYIYLYNCDSLNSDGVEYAPVIQKNPVSGKMKLYFTATRPGPVYGTTGTGFTGIFVMDVEDSLANTGTVSEVRFPFDLQAPFNLGTITFDPEGTTVIIARGSSGYKRDKRLKEVSLFTSQWQDTVWSTPEPLPFSGNETWDSSPAFSGDGQTLYFASNREGGYGGIDLWRVKRNKSGEWSEPRNMGPKINTSGNEMFPWVSPDQRLYFASDGHPGMGGLDVFIASRDGSKTTIENAGEKFNSSYDDFGLVYNDELSGYFSSNRPGGKGGDDIWFFMDKTPPKFDYFVEVGLRYSKDGNDKDGNFFAGEPVLNANVTVLKKKPPVKLKAQEVAAIKTNLVKKFEEKVEDSLLNTITASTRQKLALQYRKTLGADFKEQLEAKEQGPLATEYVNNVRDSLVQKYSEKVKDSLAVVHRQKIETQKQEIIAEYEQQVADSLANPVVTEDFEEVSSFVTGKYGMTKMDLEPGQEYTFVMAKEGTLTKRVTYKLPPLDSATIWQLAESGIKDTVYKADYELDQILAGDVIDMNNNSYDLEDIFYEYDAHVFKENQNPHIGKLVTFLNDNPQIKVELSSHCDDRGGDMYNLILSQKRANYVVEYLAQKGVDPERMVARGYGKFSLRIAEASTEEEHQENRRTEIRILSIAPLNVEAEIENISEEESRQVSSGSE